MNASKQAMDALFPLYSWLTYNSQVKDCEGDYWLMEGHQFQEEINGI